MSSAKPSLDLLRALTEEHVLRALMDHVRLTRAEIAALTGISKPTISEGVRRLVEAGLVMDTGERSTGRGRAGTYYSLSPACGAALAVSITPHAVTVEMVDAFGSVLAATEIALDGEPSVGGVATALSEAVSALGPSRIPRLAVVSVADPVDRRTGRVVHLPDAPFLVGDLDPRTLLAAFVSGPVLVDNDVNWAARAEQSAVAAGDGSRYRDFVYLYLDEGLGCAVVCDGDVRRGHSGLAGEIAHVRTLGPHGDAIRFTEVFAQLGLRVADSTAIDVERLRTRIAGAGDGNETLRALGAAVAGVLEAAVAFADPQCVVLGGEWGRDARFIDELQRCSAALPRRVPVVAAAVAERPSLTGARASALDQLRLAIIAGSSAQAPTPPSPQIPHERSTSTVDVRRQPDASRATW
jgi:predicted NBD/HSP70 family sugar kinase